MTSHSTNKKPLTIWLHPDNREAIRQLAAQLGYTNTKGAANVSEFGRALLSQMCEDNGITWDYSKDEIAQWGEHNRPDAS